MERVRGTYTELPPPAPLWANIKPRGINALGDAGSWHNWKDGVTATRQSPHAWVSFLQLALLLSDISELRE